MTDSVIENKEQVLRKVQGTLAFLEKRREEVKPALINVAGEINNGISLELAQRTIEIDAIKDRLKDLQADLKHAREDFPRREAARKKAAELENQAKELDKKAAQIQGEMEKVQAHAASLRGEAGEQISLASASLHDLGQRDKDKKAAIERTRQEEKEKLELTLRGLKAQLNQAEKSKYPEETIERLHAQIETAEKEVAAYA